MPTIENIQVLFFTLAFVIPGFILQWVIRIFVPQRSEDTSSAFLRFVTLSCLNYAVWIWLIVLIVDRSLPSILIGLQSLGHLLSLLAR